MSDNDDFGMFLIGFIVGGVDREAVVDGRGLRAGDVLVGLPFFLAGVLTLLNSMYMSPLWHTGTGRALVAFGVLSIGIGSLMLRKIVSFKG